MIQSKNTFYPEQPKKKKRSEKKKSSGRYRRIASLGKISTSIINEIYTPIDSINRFINLALQTMGEDSQSRQFLLESKQGVRKTAKLLRRLNNYAKRMEKEFQEIAKDNE